MRAVTVNLGASVVRRSANKFYLPAFICYMIYMLIIPYSNALFLIESWLLLVNRMDLIPSMQIFIAASVYSHKPICYF